MQRIYLDNAATTPLIPEVLEVMLPYLTEKFGNPSSIYSYGREAKMAIEEARKKVALHLNCKPGEIFFTSGGTESSNTAIHCALRDLGCKHIITSPIEHHATLHTVEYINKSQGVKLSYVKITENGHVDIDSLEEILKNATEKCLVTLMHANNEIGNMLDLEAVSNLCKKYNAILHSDTVQTVGHFKIDVQKTPVHFLNGAGHKFHGPKGTGILYINNEVNIQPYLMGGAQERNMRAGTENVAGIVGFAKALDLAMENIDADVKKGYELKNYMHEELLKAIPTLKFNGDVQEQSLYSVLNVAFDVNDNTEMLLMNLDMAGICVSGGSACSSGASGGSHVISHIYPTENRLPVRFSFSRHSTKQEVDIAVVKVKELMS
jgi:cysteine desulfurase